MQTEPPVKKSRMEDLNKYIEMLKISQKNLKPVFKDELLEKIPTVSCHAGHIKDNKLISKTLEVLNERVPLGSLQHLKRVFMNSILVCTEEYLLKTEFGNIQDLLDNRAPELKDAFDYFKVVQAPVRMPSTTVQNTECRKQWPCNFHPSPYLNKLVSGKFFNPSELREHRKYMATTVFIAKSYAKIDDLLTLQDSNYNAAVIVDPMLNQIVAAAYDYREDHPIQHAAMVAVDNVAKAQGGGAWKCHKDDKLIHTITNDSEFKKSTEQALPTAYLCTGYDMYLLREPCLMCAMGLLHARVKRVFYLFDNEKQGAVKTKTKLQFLAGLNHRYEVFTGFDV